jgi:rhamnogalacturonan endolyase
MYNAPTGAIVGDAWSENFRVYWDGDIYDELLNGVGGGHNQPYLEKAGEGRMAVDGKQLYEYGYSVTCNGTKTTPCLSADIFGDWREEMIFFNNEDKATLNIFSTSHETAARVPCLMYDHTYRLGIAWQNVGYNQPPHLGYYLPDAVAARFTPLDERTVHYVNCIGAKVVSVTAPDDTVSDDLPVGITMEQDTRLCDLLFDGQAEIQGEWQVTIASIDSSNGIETTATLTLDFSNAVGIKDIHDILIDDSQFVYDLSGRRVENPAHSGIYVTKGKTVVIK